MSHLDPDVLSSGGNDRHANNFGRGESRVESAVDRELSKALSEYPRIMSEEEARELSLLSAEERLLLFADVYGHTPEGELEKLEAFDREVSRLPASRKEHLHRGYTAGQARLFPCIECGDARAAAVRMARYWELRHRLRGEDAFSGDFAPARTTDDFRRIYEMAQRAVNDPEVDSETQQWANNFIGSWNGGHIMSLDTELEDICPDEKAAFAEAQMLRPDLAASDEHKLLFLRSEDFDAQRAARRMVKYWDLWFSLFGSFCRLEADTLMEECLIEMSLNFFLLLPGTDASSRALFLLAPQKVMNPEDGHDIEKVLKTMWYVVHSAMENKMACLENGIVILVVAKNHFRPRWEFTSGMMRLMFECIPMKVKAVHNCAAPSPWFLQQFMPVVKYIIGRRLRARYQVHTGMDEQIVAELEACGISRELIPAEVGGVLNVDSLGVQWLEQQRGKVL